MNTNSLQVTVFCPQTNRVGHTGKATKRIHPRIFVQLFNHAMTLQFQSLDELDMVSRQLLNEAGPNRIWLFHGEMGAGKTTLIKALCRAVGVVSMVQSPTFGLVNEYTTQTNEPVYHFDCYRLRNEIEAMDIGLEEYFDSGHYCFVEWPERVEAIWPDSHYKINLVADETGKRTAETVVVG